MNESILSTDNVEGLEVSEAPAPSYQDFKDWMVKNPGRIPEVERVYSESQLRAIGRGALKVDGINNGRRLKLYEITQLELFKYEPEVHPDDLDIEKLSNGEQPRSLIRLRIEYNKENLGDLAKNIGVSRPTLRNYIECEDQDKKLVSQIEAGLSKYYNPNVAELATVESQIIGKPLDDSYRQPSGRNPVLEMLTQLNENIQGVRTQIGLMSDSDLAASLLNNPNELSQEQRRDTVYTAIGIIAEQMDYYRTADLAERKKLARGIDLNQWGWVKSILGSIDQPDGENTFSRFISKDSFGK